MVEYCPQLTLAKLQEAVVETIPKAASRDLNAKVADPEGETANLSKLPVAAKKKE